MSDAGFQIEMGLEANPPETIQSRAKDSLADYLNSFQWDSFYTATFKQPMRYAAGVLDKLRPVCLDISARSLIVAEQHVSGLWHAHGLLYYPHQPGFTYTLDNSYAGERISKLGWASTSLVRSRQAATLYCSKYLLKDSRMEWELLGKKRFWTSPS